VANKKDQLSSPPFKNYYVSIMRKNKVYFETEAKKLYKNGERITAVNLYHATKKKFGWDFGFDLAFGDAFQTFFNSLPWWNN